MASSKVVVAALCIPRNPVSHTPNTSLHSLPLLLYWQAFEAPNKKTVTTTLERNGFPPAWVYGMYPFSHYHSMHEVLCVLSGRARLRFGGEVSEGADVDFLERMTTGESSPDGPVEVEVESGDVMVIPAGVAHRNVWQRDGFQMTGAYQDGVSFDMWKCSKREEEAVEEQIKSGGGLRKDPVFGEEDGSPVRTYWKL